jgi:hypothetical protein
MELLLTGIFSVAALVFTAYPLMNRKKYSFDIDDLFESREGKAISHLNAKKLVVDENLRELELEHEMGKLSDRDFGLLRDGLQTESASLDGEIEKHKIKNTIDELIEREIKSRRRLDDTK